ncbi:ABC transporter related protein [Jimgerdemannia flammicorona]|uniref:ABC transporter related protein n=1 Tax=Jimgerdemannia flammicorona TaxID=994334 RepID=A0A433QBF8_9FUNG|nr:ABC transporter related protein [Jimgerdemannia flammicorona]
MPQVIQVVDGDESKPKITKPAHGIEADVKTIDNTQTQTDDKTISPKDNEVIQDADATLSSEADSTSPSETAIETGEKKYKKIDPSEEKLSLSNVAIALKLLPRVIGLSWTAQPYLCMLMAIISFFNGIEPIFRIGTDAMLLDVVMTAIKTQDMNITYRILYFTSIQMAMSFFSYVLGAIHSLTEQQLSSSVNTYMDLAVMEHTLKLDLSYFEDPEVSEIIREAEGVRNYYPLATLRNLLCVAQNLVTFFAMSALLFNNSKWFLIVPIALLNPVVSFLVGIYLSFASYKRFTQDRSQRRMMYYITDLISTESMQKELKLFNIGEYFIELYKKLDSQIKDSDHTENVFQQTVWTLLSTFSNLTSSALYYLIAVQTIHQEITLSDMTRYTTATASFGYSFRTILSDISSTYDCCLRLKVVFDFFDLQPLITYPEDGVKYCESEDAMILANAANESVQNIHHSIGSDAGDSSPSNVIDGIITNSNLSSKRRTGMKIEFRNVSFKYPGKKEHCLKGISFVVQPGEIIALVGYNGAGKTTLIKLMMRLYVPESGNILINDRNIEDFDLPDLRSHVSIIFQDFNHYEMKVSENIGIGSLSHMNDLPAIQAAAVKSGADEVSAKLAQGYDHQLGRRFHDDGAELSGGEWQKVALSRAFMRDADAGLLVLDEPTSALDALAEHEVFAKIRMLSQGKTAIFISHRFSTVRNADRILVIEGGIIRENGSHDQLLELGGRYAELFNLQAEAYK